MMSHDDDFLDELMEESTAQDPAYPQIYAAALKRAEAHHSLARTMSNSMLPKASVGHRLEREGWPARGQRTRGNA